MKKKNGFTLIELLAVIIILGILMIIAIPSVTKYISDSRKSSYVDTAKEIMAGARNIVNEGKLGMYDTNTTYYIPSSYIKTENASKSPYGDFVQAYVVVTYNGQGYNYYWISVDDAGQGVREIVSYDKLDTDDIVSDIDPGEVENYVKTSVVGNRNTIKILDTERVEWITPVEPITNHVPEEGTSVVIYPDGKSKEDVEIGDIITIVNEEFYLVNRDGSDLVLLSRYNLNIGDNKKEGATEGIQDSEVKGFISGGITYGNIAFSSTNYWSGKVGTDYSGNYCSSSSGTNCAYIFDANSYLKPYIDNYKSYLESYGVIIKDARLMTIEESVTFKTSNQSAWKETSYWLGSARTSTLSWSIGSEGAFKSGRYDYADDFGVRPIIII